MPRAIAILAAGCLLLVAGCGEKEETERTSSDEFLASGDEICRESQARLEELRAEPVTGPEHAAQLTEEVIAVFEDEIAQLRELDAPEELSDEHEDYLAERERSLEPLRRGLEAAEAGDFEAYAAANAEAAGGQVERAELAGAVGFSDCSRPGGSAPTGGESP